MFWVLDVDLQEFLRFVLVMHDRHFFALLYLHDCPRILYHRAKLVLELNQISLSEITLLKYVGVEVGREVVHICRHGVALF